jgi:hypothetical protein
MNRRLAPIVVIALLASDISAQERSPDERNVPGVSGQSFWSASLAYPETLAAGVTVVLGSGGWVGFRDAVRRYAV